MDHPASVSRPLVWRTTAVVAAAVAAFELALIVLITLTFVGDSSTERGDRTAARNGRAAAAASARPGAKKAAAPAAKKERAPRLPRAETSVMILNGNGVQGAAAQATERVRRFAYVITGTGNAPRSDFARSLVMYRRGFRGEALRLARDLGVGRVAPLDGMRPGDLQGAELALIIGAS